MQDHIIQKAFDKRRSHHHEPATDAFRILNGPADGGPAGVALDQYGGWLVLTARAKVDRSTVMAWAETAVSTLGAEGLVLKTLEEEARLSRSEPLFGSPPHDLMVHEGDAVFECQLDQGPQTGLFLDHRTTRWRIRPFAQGVEVLNLFAYTGSFSVHAALAGASRVTSVDIAPRALRWARRNMSHNNLDPNQHRWFTDDALDHLKRPRHTYGLVVLDPPVFGRGRKAFSLFKDLSLLMRGAFQQLHDGGILVVSTHHTGIGFTQLARTAELQAQHLGLEIEKLEKLGLPEWDHPTLPQSSSDADRGDYLNTLIVHLRSLIRPQAS